MATATPVDIQTNPYDFDFAIAGQGERCVQFVQIFDPQDDEMHPVAVNLVGGRPNNGHNVVSLNMTPDAAREFAQALLKFIED